MVKQKLITHYNQYKRVWRLLKKPTMTEFKTISKITAIGLMVIGLMGFLVTLLMTAFF
jgi:protein transport protein SEC61 subunit gamma-like protein